MCGIFGIINLKIEEKYLSNLIKIMNHRGPDESGYYKDINDESLVILGHNRLSILDIENGSQPMISQDKNFVVVFNGEIYNFSELREQLISLGHKFSTSHSDTEILIHGFKEWGKHLPEHLNGMWSFAIYNRGGEKIFTTNNPLKGWDGTFNGNIVQDGNYVYHLQYINGVGNLTEKKDIISLVR